jgi:hypothetical protein
MNRKQQAKQHEDWLKKENRIAAGYVKDRFPNVKTIKIKKVFVDFDDNREFTKEPVVWNIPLDRHAIFDIECPMWECVDGGFDLTDVINNMVKDHKTTEEGVQRCEGWQDPERVGQHHCYTKLEYKIDIEYNNS